MNAYYLKMYWNPKKTNLDTARKKMEKIHHHVHDVELIKTLENSTKLTCFLCNFKRSFKRQIEHFHASMDIIARRKFIIYSWFGAVIISSSLSYKEKVPREKTMPSKDIIIAI